MSLIKDRTVTLGERVLPVHPMPLKYIVEIDILNESPSLPDKKEQARAIAERWIAIISLGTGVPVDELREIPCTFRDYMDSYRTVLEVAGMLLSSGEAQAERSTRSNGGEQPTAV